MTTFSEIVRRIPPDIWRPVFQTPHQRADSGILAKFLRLVLPRDPEPVMVFPLLAETELKEHKISRWRLLALAIMMMGLTIGLITLLLQVPGLHYSVVDLLTMGFDYFVPHGFAIGLAWVSGLFAVIKLGGFIKHSAIQRELDAIPATRFGFYNLWLRLALWEEMVFRAGSEKWNWGQRLWVSFVFGAIHVINIWYSMAAGLALGLTGFGFMLVYQWYYRKTKDQILATAASGVVHALYNTIAMGILMLVGFFFILELVLHVFM